MLVPTMGALHDGHLALVRAAKRVPGSVVVVSIFVNPLQFGAGEDLDAYPRTLDDDLALLRGEGVEIVFAPTAAAMYPDGLRTTVQPGPLAAELEGAARPTHFAGVLTVVLKLLQIVRPGPDLLRREGLSAAGADPADGRRPERRRRGDRCADRAGIRWAGDVVAQPLPGFRAARTGRRRCRRRCWPGRMPRPAVREAALTGGPRRARRRARDRRRLPGAARPRAWSRPGQMAPAGCWSPPGSARPDCWTTSQSKSELPSAPTG